MDVTTESPVSGEIKQPEAPVALTPEKIGEPSGEVAKNAWETPTPTPTETTTEISTPPTPEITTTPDSSVGDATTQPVSESKPPKDTDDPATWKAHKDQLNGLKSEASTPTEKPKKKSWLARLNPFKVSHEVVNTDTPLKPEQVTAVTNAVTSPTAPEAPTLPPLPEVKLPEATVEPPTPVVEQIKADVPEIPVEAAAFGDQTPRQAETPTPESSSDVTLASEHSTKQLITESEEDKPKIESLPTQPVTDVTSEVSKTDTTPVVDTEPQIPEVPVETPSSTMHPLDEKKEELPPLPELTPLDSTLEDTTQSTVAPQVPSTVVPGAPDHLQNGVTPPMPHIPEELHKEVHEAPSAPKFAKEEATTETAEQDTTTEEVPTPSEPPIAMPAAENVDPADSINTSSEKSSTIPEYIPPSVESTTDQIVPSTNVSQTIIATPLATEDSPQPAGDSTALPKAA